MSMIGKTSPQAFVAQSEIDRIVTDSVAATQPDIVAGDQSAAARVKNHIINGCMRKNSEGAASYGASGYCLDQVQMYVAGSGHTVTQENTVAGTSGLTEGTGKVLKSVVSSVVGASNNALIAFMVEGADTLAGKTVTFSFTAKTDAVKSFGLELDRNYQGSTADFINLGLVEVGTTYTRHTVTFVMPTVAGKTLGTGNKMQFNFWLDAGTDFDSRASSVGHQSGTWEITEVGLYEGDTAPPWQAEDPAVLDAQCARFYWYSARTRTLKNYTTSIQDVWVDFPVPMRAVPSLTIPWQEFTPDVVQISETSLRAFITSATLGTNRYTNSITADARL